MTEFGELGAENRGWKNARMEIGISGTVPGFWITVSDQGRQSAAKAAFTLSSLHRSAEALLHPISENQESPIAAPLRNEQLSNSTNISEAGPFKPDFGLSGDFLLLE
jgi:hypothetical protein